LHDNFINLESNLSKDTLKVYQQMEQHIKENLYSFFLLTRVFPEATFHANGLLPRPGGMKRVNLQSTNAKILRINITCPSLANFIEYKRIRSSCSKVLKKQKRFGWRKYCSQFNYKTPTSEIWALIKLFKKRKLTNSSVFSDSNLHAHLIQATIAKLCPPSCLHLQWSSLHLLVEADKHQSNINCNLDNLFLEIEMDAAINNMNLKSAPGIDQIDYSVIFSLPRISIFF